MDYDDFTFENYQILRNLGPYGEGFDEPTLSYTFKNRYYNFFGNMKQHLRGSINKQCSYVAFNVDKNLLDREQITLIGKLELDTYRNNKKLSFKVSEIK